MRMPVARAFRSILFAALSAGLLAATAAPARASILDRLLPWFSGSIATQGLSLHFNGSLTANTVELKDASGVYATFQKVKIVWSPFALIHGDIKVDTLTAQAGDIARLPASSGGHGSSIKNLDLGKLEIGKLTLEKPVAGENAVLMVTASGHMHASGMGGELTADRLDAQGTYHLVGSKTAEAIKLDLSAHEAPGGIISAEAKLPDIGPIGLDATLDGPESALATDLKLAAGQLNATATGTVDLTGKTIPGLQVTASAPAMSPRPDLSWTSVALDAHVSGPFAAPDLTGKLRIAALKAGATSAQLIALTADGNQGDIKLAGEIDGLVVPGKAPDAFAATPVRLTADAKLKAPAEPVVFSVQHPLVQADGQGSIKNEQVNLHLLLPQLAPLGAIAGEQIDGHAALAMQAGRQNDVITLAANGTVAITGGKAPVPALVGDNGKIDLAAQVQGTTLHLTKLSVNGQDVRLSASGTASKASVALQFAAGLPNVTPIDARLSGGLNAHGTITGATTALAVDTTVQGELAAEGESSGPFTAHLVAQGLPSAPSGTLTAEGSLLSSPIDVALAGSRSADGAYHLTIDKADWKTLAAGGTLALPAGATLPVGNLSLTIGNLADFSTLFGKPLTGSARASLNAESAVWHAQADVQGVSVPNVAALGDARLHLTLDHPDHDPLVNGALVLSGLRTSTVGGDVRMTASGNVSALALKADADLTKLRGAPAKLTATGVADIPARGLRLDAFAADWKGQNARLLAPVSFQFRNGVSIDDLRLGLRNAVIRVNGHVGQTLDLTASATNVPASLASLVSPSYAAAGTISADARITGTTSAPTGTVSARATGLRLLTGKESGLPPANLTAKVDLLRNAAKLDVAAQAGQSRLSVAGRTGLSMTEPMDLRATGLVDFANLDALLPSNDRATGRMTLNAAVAGTPAAPTGTVRASAPDLRVTTGTGVALPPASLTAAADLMGRSAKLNVAARAGASHLTVAGQAGFATSAPLDLRANGVIDMATADALLPANERAAGRIVLAANVTGTASKPDGTVRVDASGVRLLTGSAAGLPPANLVATAALSGETARITSRLTAGASYITVNGTAGIAKNAPLDLRAAGRVDLAAANPILLANGEAAEGTLALDADVLGTLDAPRITGGATLSNGDIRDYAAGVHLSQVAARLTGEGGTLRLVSLRATAGKGTISGSGSVGLLTAGMPVNIVITAADASPISSDILNATLNANLAITGQLENTVTLAGRVFVVQALIQVPNTLPTSVVTIPVRIAGEPPPKPKPPSKLLADIAMNLTVRAPEKVFIRGRGLNAELGGTIHIAGTTTKMVPTGGFKLVRGSFNLVGNTLTFTSGTIDFNGATITDPALHLVAQSTGANMVATLTVGGTARAPKITLSSVPEMPQDQILAQLLFHANAGALSPFQLASIAAGLAQITGTGGGITSPLTGLQNALGLDQLGITTGPNGAPAVQAGRYIGRGIFVGAEEATGGTGARAKVEVQLTKRLKATASAGTGETTNVIGATGQSTGATVGLSYQFEY